MNQSKDQGARIKDNLAEVAKIKKENPAVTHINLRREDDVLVDIPIANVELTIKNHPAWNVEDGAVAELKTFGQRAEEMPVITKKPSEEKAAETETETLPVKEDAIDETEKPTKKTTKAKK